MLPPIHPAPEHGRIFRGPLGFDFSSPTSSKEKHERRLVGLRLSVWPPSRTSNRLHSADYAAAANRGLCQRVRVPGLLHPATRAGPPHKVVRDR